ncbi:cation-translocating P-type ATPase [Vulcaniibacterium gelatinicum]|uniref:cation-translocating P-type ATPase n=1 Tax=Vulcaniibacterium gelatinicum TaxID=2598725 RepID=UPI0011C8A714|nr:cation-translocating P-type ATPase [Vulcaniibacterium gelatinicum]
MSAAPAPASLAAGLSAAEAARRLARDGPNVLPQPDRRRWPQVLASVLREPMLLLLLAAVAVYVALGDPGDAVALAVSVLLVVALTLYQELRAERALQALRELGAPLATVRRDGVWQRMPATLLVVGDVVRIAEGDRIPADARLLDSDDLHVDESLLTGESAPVAHAAGDAGTTAQVYAGTLVVRGQGMAEVIATGPHTEMGRIGASLGTLRSGPTPLQREIRRLVGWFATLALASCVLVAVLYLWLRGGLLDALLAGITLAMSNIPEEFPVVLTVFLALGAWRMARHRVLVRRPPAIEALGAVTVLCTDKTGTLTENRMALARLQPPRAEPLAPDAGLDHDARALLQCAALASDADGLDPMDRAIHATAAARTGSAAQAQAVCLERYPVAPGLPAYAAAWRLPDHDTILVACKGAPETIAMLCALDDGERAQVLAQAAAMATQGLRVLAVAEARVDADAGPPAALPGLPFVWRGLLGLADPLRAEVPAAVAEARAAGVRVILLTGDHVETARAIAAQAGVSERPEVALGAELERLDDDGLHALLSRVDVFARVRPEHKLRLVQALRRSGEVVAMTGDGVNDAPALMAAHVGVAMGGRGTDVAREAASIVLLDDDFVSVVRAIRMGRTIYDNIHRAARYIIAVHVPITGLALLPLLLGMPLILLPLHVVFLELIIDPVSAIVLEREPPAPDLMRRPPRAPGRRLVDTATFLASLGYGLAVFTAVATVYLLGRGLALPPPQTGAAAFAALVAGNLGLVLVQRETSGPPWRSLLRPNRAFQVVSVCALAMLAVIVCTETAGAWFRFAPPPPWLGLLALALPWLVLAALFAAVRRFRAATPAGLRRTR